MSPKLRFDLQSAGGNTTDFEIPDQVVADLGGGGHPKVHAHVGRGQIRGAIARMGGAYWLGVSAADRTACDRLRPRARGRA
ncbi:DUF1905 domain-containing protein [Demetria terragena]|uniref:DUF1905 domain-containing protein n=1 Tax=Demetria terragena TaxID=63959 RepID=UPI001461333F